MQTTKNLRLALRLNAAFSTLSAVILLAGHTAVGEIMGVDPALLIGVGIGLGAFAGMLLFTAARQDLAKLRAEALRHSLADFAWVIASIGVIAAGVLTPAGNAMLAAVAVPVLALGIAQIRSLPPKRSSSKIAAA
jgi:hypothetical protein